MQRLFLVLGFVGCLLNLSGCLFKDANLICDVDPENDRCICGQVCEGATPICDHETKQCVAASDAEPCQNNEDCEGELVCNEASGRCVEQVVQTDCSEDSDCIGAAYPACVNEQCRECSVENDSACGEKEKCDVATSRCVVQTCADKTCPMGWDCDEETISCFECKSDVGCGEGEVCNPATLSCVECLNNNDCPNAEASRCEIAEGANQFTCQPCGNNIDCTGTGFPFCVLGECQSCLGVNEGCAEGLVCNAGTCELPPPPSCTEDACQMEDENLHCDGELGRCVSCLRDAHCPDKLNAPVCDVDTRSCVGCQRDVDCKGSSETTSCVIADGEDRGECIPCENHTDCDGHEDGRYCQTGRVDDAPNRCVSCRIDAHCTEADAPRCNIEEGECLPCNPGAPEPNTPCTEANASRCTAAGQCEACEGDLDCVHLSQTPFCQEGVCVQCRDGGNDCNRFQYESICDRNTYFCVQCSRSEDCDDGFDCTNNKCEVR